MFSWHESFLIYRYMRKPRQLTPQAIYHVCARANRQEMILDDVQIKYMFLDVVEQAKKKFGFLMRNFCIMGNHIHLEIEPQNDYSLSKIMQWILSVFAIRYNKLYSYKGHVWYDRFKSKIIQGLRQLVNTFFYIASNPVRAGVTLHPLEFECNGLTFHKHGARWPRYNKLLDPVLPEISELLNNYLECFDKKTNAKHNPEYSFHKEKQTD